MTNILNTVDSIGYGIHADTKAVLIIVVLITFILVLVKSIREE